ncbi:MAG: HAMP domain-containing histidine kinase [Myxococcaceae bacterium]|nr:HAMP domain-containing histidine kinase [Myxococcaceae bacterium]
MQSLIGDVPTYSAEVRKRLDPALTKRAVISLLVMGAVTVGSVAGDWPRFGKMLAVFVGSTLFNAIIGRKMDGLTQRWVPQLVFAFAGGGVVLVYGLLSDWSMVSLCMVALNIAVFESFGDGGTRPYVIAMLAVTALVLHASGVAPSIIVPLMLLSFGVHWMSDGRAMTLSTVLAGQAKTNLELELSHAALAAEMKARLFAEAELRQAQKLESVGRLAAGVAHEINTPAQFVHDSVEFLGRGVGALTTLLETYQASTPKTPALVEAEAAADAEFLLENLPDAIERSRQGIDRINVIVRSMKDFAHPDRTEMHAVDLNRAVASTLVVAASEYRLVADLETDFGALPPVVCHGGEVNQVVLNLVVNAAHAIADVAKAGGQPRGKISVRTRHEDGQAVVWVGDTGGGVPEAIRDRIFDPFFTTKEVGRGTGQGLAIASAVVARHGGALTFESELGRGTTFCVRLPVEPRAHVTAP